MKKIKLIFLKYQAYIHSMLLPLGIWGPGAISAIDSAAFGIPILQQATKGLATQAIILVPTRELAVQVEAEIKRLAQYTPIRSTPVYGGEKIAAREIPARIVYEDDLVLAFHDVKPQAPTHVLIVPKKAITRVSEATPEDHKVLGHLLLKAAEIAKQLGLDQSGCDYRHPALGDPNGRVPLISTVLQLL